MINRVWTAFVALIILSTISLAETVCHYSDKTSCPSDLYCIHFDKNKDICWPVYNGVLKKIAFPYGKTIPIVCDQGHLSPDGNSHTWHNTAFALDLHIPRKSSFSSDLFAGIDGRVIAHSSCRTQNDQCGVGFGNHVKILSNDGFMVFYAHLDQVLVKTGDLVKVGKKIGTEGMTGHTGKENPHVHMSVHFNWKSGPFDYWKRLSYLPPSVPFQMKYYVGPCESGRTAKFEDIRKLDCLRTRPNASPICSL